MKRPLRRPVGYGKSRQARIHPKQGTQQRKKSVLYTTTTSQPWLTDIQIPTGWPQAVSIARGGLAVRSTDLKVCPIHQYWQCFPEA
jgi:hypothetical protein